MKAINLKSGIKSIGAYAFRNCEAVDDIKLCSGLETIYAYAFIIVQVLKQSPCLTHSHR